MQYGYCLDVKFLKGDETSRTIFEAVAAAGFDYVELPFSALSELSRDEFTELKDELKKIPCKACNLFFPPSLTLVGLGMDASGILVYLEKMLPLAAELDVENLVFGNGGARKTPKGVTRESVLENLRLIVETMEIFASKTGIIISVEPLNTTETDMINSYGEAIELTQGLHKVATMIDSYHVAMEKQNFDDVLKNPDRLKHLHTAFPTGRLVPSPQDDMNAYSDFVNTIKKIGFNDKISIEGALRATEPAAIRDEIKAALGVLKGFFN
jgi:sugar phosphate isomerase/epimerase